MRDPGRTRTPRRTLVVLVVLAVLLPAVGAGAQSSIDDLRSNRETIRAERERLQAERAAVAVQVDTIRATDAEVSAALADLEELVRAEEGRLDDAQRAVDAAELQVLEALAAQQAAQAEVDSLREAMAAAAVDAYVRPPEQDTLSVLLSGDLGNAAERRALMDVSASSQSDLLEQFRAAQEDLELWGQAAAEATARAEEQRAVVADQVEAVAAARDQQALVVAEVQQRLDAAMAESARLAATDSELAATDAALAAEIAEKQAELQRQLARASVRRGPVSVPNVGTIQLTSVGGIVVNSAIAGQLASMLDAAAADGIVLTGGGFRDSSMQVQLRRQHCGTSDYAIYQMSPSACRPPTARPGQSLHEQGLAIDFVANGASITSRGSAGFQWLAANASRYGLYNLPSEPWHWSTTGG